MGTLYIVTSIQTIEAAKAYIITLAAKDNSKMVMTIGTGNYETARGFAIGDEIEVGLTKIG